MGTLKHQSVKQQQEGWHEVRVLFLVLFPIPVAYSQDDLDFACLIFPLLLRW